MSSLFLKLAKKFLNMSENQQLMSLKKNWAVIGSVEQQLKATIRIDVSINIDEDGKVNRS